MPLLRKGYFTSEGVRSKWGPILMKNLVMTVSLVISSLLLSLSASAEVFEYRLYEDSVGEVTPYVLSIEMDGPFRKGSGIQKITLRGEYGDQSILLFSWSEEDVSKLFNSSWNSDNTLNLTASANYTFKSLVTKTLSNPWGDTDINPTDDYAVWIEDMVLDKDGSRGDTRFEIANSTVEEACLWGILKK